ncbi:helix-turn-helix domain-containing protein [Leucobacter sp. NPDC058333]|uniref:helix-turn-helix domain-containing protein n=1 Tax=Leucobacter sp. NPDC058333 TaxID=3346450 RepID=UPI00364711A4
MERFKRTQTNEIVVGEIRAAMARKGLKPLAVAAAVGMNRSSIYRRLNGDTPFDLDEILAIADVLEVPASSFFPLVRAA